MLAPGGNKRLPRHFEGNFRNLGLILSFNLSVGISLPSNAKAPERGKGIRWRLLFHRLLET